MKELALSRGGLCLSKTYANSKSHLMWKCANGHTWSTSYGSVSSGHWCPSCAGKLKGTIEEMQSIARERDGKCLSKKYVNRYTKLEWQCAKGHVWWSTPTHVKSSGSWCPYCARTVRLTIGQMRDLAIEREGECLSTEYINQNTKLKWRCKKGHIWFARPSCIGYSHTWCPECGGKKKGTIEQMVAIASSRNGRCLSKVYRNKDTKLEWQCSEGHRWWARPHDIKHGNWCGECVRGLGERISRVYFELIFGRKFPNLKPQWLRNQRGYLMQLDGYCEELNLAFEYQGHQHYLSSHFHRSVDEFEMRKSDDELKKKLCRQKGVSLIEIPYTIESENIYEFVVKKCRRAHIPIPTHQRKALNDIEIYSPAGKMYEMGTVATKRGGQFLSKEYLGSHEKHTWVCNRGHQWQARPYSVKAGHWCPNCAGLAKLTISEMQQIASDRGGKCLTKRYTGNNKTHLHWECSKGHTWRAIPNSIKRGRWCPVCALEK